MSTITELIDQTIEAQGWLDQVATPLQRTVSTALRPGPIGTPLRDLLDGTMLGHPLHPALTDVPIGAWTYAFLADIVDVFTGQQRPQNGTSLAIGLGLAGALGSALSGLADWSYTEGTTRRLGVSHGLLNVAATALYAGSLAFRLRGRYGAARGLSSAGYGIALFSAYLGGELAYRCGLGVDHAAFQPTVPDYVQVLPDSDLAEGQSRGVNANGTPVLLTRQSGQVFAIGDTCTHLGCSLAEGQVTGDIVTCPCHDSQFNVTTGAVVRGPASFPAAHFDVRSVDGWIQVRRSPPVC